MSIDVTIVSSKTQELAELVRASGMRAASAPAVELLKLAQPGAQPAAVVVLDLRHQSSVPPALMLLKKEQPATGIVIVAAKLEPALMLEAMRMGVTEYVTEPVAREDLAAAIVRASGNGRSPHTCEVLGIIGVKGGVGVTTLAVNIATTLAQQAPGSVLLIDLHAACGDSALFLGAQPRFTMLDALENTSRLDESYLKGLVEKTKAGPDLLASPDRVFAVHADAPRIRAVVEAATRCYRYVVLDVPRSDSSVAGALELTSSITVVTTQDMAALRNGNRLTTFLRQRYGADRVRVVANRFDRAAEISDAELEQAMGGRVSATFPSADRLVVDALNKGLPLVSENHSKLAAALSNYAVSLVTTSETESSSERSSGLFGMLGRRRTSSK